MKVGIISGHPLPGLIRNPEELMVETPYGDVHLNVSKHGNHTLFFLHRHGEHLCLPPHKVKYQANIQALSSSHVESIFSVGTVGSMKKNILPGSIVLPHDFIDMTKTRSYTFFNKNRVHIDMSQPFCPYLRKALIKSCTHVENLSFHKNGVYLSTEGPRLETISEIKLFSHYADVVGMTLVPEIILAREKGICFSSLCVVCNMAAGLQKKLPADEISLLYKQIEPILSKILKVTLSSLPEKRSCTHCSSDITKATL
jgi:5'-methylthioadenosine phosphorylase